MKWSELFRYESRAEAQARQQAYGERIFPLGEGQREAALALLRPHFRPALPAEEVLFAFISSKEEYLNAADGEGDAAAVRQLQQLRWLKDGERRAARALVRLDIAADSLGCYPDARQLQAEMDALPDDAGK